MKVKAHVVRKKKGEMEQEGRVRLLAELDSVLPHRAKGRVDSEICDVEKKTSLTGGEKPLYFYILL